ncbi:MAG: glutamate synthase-related protein [Candidatus Paceibacterota bacterium]
MRGVIDSPENRKKCLCSGCPSHPAPCGGELLYCGNGASKCDISAKGCFCSGCQVYSENNLTGLYFCDKEVGVSTISMRKKGKQESEEDYESIVNIKEIANTGHSIVCSMGSRKKSAFSFDDIHFLPAQAWKIPLNLEDSVNMEVVIGPQSQKPLKISCPIMITGMSFGAVSKNVKLSIAGTAKELKIAFNSGEGGILREDLDLARQFLIGQYATGRFGFSEENFKDLGAIEIRFGQGAYPGKGSYLPASKITEEIAAARGLKAGEASYSPAHHPDMANPKQIKEKVSWLKKIGGGIPVGAKIGCGNIEKDIEVLVNANVDFIAIDGFCGGTGATDLYVRENVGIPLIAALPRAREILKIMGRKNKISLIASGGLRTSADFAKCLALGADAVYIGTAALIAINCEQYRICHTGQCPTGVTTQNPELMKQLDPEKGKQRLINFVKVSAEEIANLVRIVGKKDVNELNEDDLVAMNKELAELAGIKWLNGEYL